MFLCFCVFVFSCICIFVFLCYCLMWLGIPRIHVSPWALFVVVLIGLGPDPIEGRAGTTKGTGGDILILDEAAYVDSDFFYETVAPLLLVGVTSLICISTLTSEIKWVCSVSFFECPRIAIDTPQCTRSFYTRLFKVKDPVTQLPAFSQLQVPL